MLRELIFTVILCSVNCLTIKKSITNESETEILSHHNSEIINYENNLKNASYEYWDEEDLSENLFDYYERDGEDMYFTSLGTKIKPKNTGVRPAYYDWNALGSVSPVKNQGVCGACWAFSVIANIESHLKIYLDVKELLSEQFLIDCDRNHNGCSSASLLKTFAYIVANFHGVLRQRDYPDYEGRPLECRWNGNPRPIPVVGFRRIKQNEELMAEAIYKYGPLSAAINSASMDKYKGHFIDEPTEQACSSKPDNLDHAILIVGYSVYVNKINGKKVPYWIIKNSWGDEWGDNGYYYLVRGRNACGIANDVSFAFVN